MNKKLDAFTINTLKQAENIFFEAKIFKIRPIFHLNYYILRGFGDDFVLTFQKKLKTQFGKSSFKFFVDCGFDYSLCINMITNKIDFVKLRGNSVILSKIRNIADKNRVLLNPNFNIVDCRNIKKINFKIKKLYLRKKNED